MLCLGNNKLSSYFSLDYSILIPALMASCCSVKFSSIVFLSLSLFLSLYLSLLLSFFSFSSLYLISFNTHTSTVFFTFNSDVLALAQLYFIPPYSSLIIYHVAPFLSLSLLLSLSLSLSRCVLKMLISSYFFRVLAPSFSLFLTLSRYFFFSLSFSVFPTSRFTLFLSHPIFSIVSSKQ